MPFTLPLLHVRALLLMLGVVLGLLAVAVLVVHGAAAPHVVTVGAGHMTPDHGVVWN